MPASLRKQGNIAILELEGKLALGAGVEDFRAKWTDALATGSRDIVVVMTRVPAVDSSGIGSIIRCHSAVNQAGGHLKVVGAADGVQHSFKITRLARIFEFHDNEASAISSLAS